MAYTAQPTGFLADLVTRIRDYSDEPGDEAKYSTDKLFPLIKSSWERIMTDVHGLAENPLVVRYSLTTVADQAEYYLPPNVGQILRFGESSEQTGLVTDWIVPRSRLNPAGPGIIFEGPSVIFQPVPKQAKTLVVEYIPNGDCSLHLGTFAASDSDVSTTGFRLDTSPDEGYFDRRPNAYLGCVLRILDQSGGSNPSGYQYFPIQERTITGYTATTGAVTVAPAFDFDPSDLTGSTLTYEIVPFLGDQFIEAIAWAVVARLRGIAKDKDGMSVAMQFYRETMRSIRINLSSYNQRTGSAFRADVPGVGRYGSNVSY